MISERDQPLCFFHTHLKPFVSQSSVTEVVQDNDCVSKNVKRTLKKNILSLSDVPRTGTAASRPNRSEFKTRILSRQNRFQGMLCAPGDCCAFCCVELPFAICKVFHLSQRRPLVSISNVLITYVRLSCSTYKT